MKQQCDWSSPLIAFFFLKILNELQFVLCFSNQTGHAGHKLIEQSTTVHFLHEIEYSQAGHSLWLLPSYADNAIILTSTV